MRRYRWTRYWDITGIVIFSLTLGVLEFLWHLRAKPSLTISAFVAAGSVATLVLFTAVVVMLGPIFRKVRRRLADVRYGFMTRDVDRKMQRLTRAHRSAGITSQL